MSAPLTKEEFVRMWRCNNMRHQAEKPGGCWTSSHISRGDILSETQRCADTCNCWRHRILELTNETGAYIGPAAESPEEQRRIRQEELESLVKAQARRQSELEQHQIRIATLKAELES